MAWAGHIFTQRWQRVHFSRSIIGSPFSFMVIASLGHSLSQRAPQAMHLPGISRAVPRGRFRFLGSSIILITGTTSLFLSSWLSTAWRSLPVYRTLRREFNLSLVPG